jgi:hypothetical protein
MNMITKSRARHVELARLRTERGTVARDGAPPCFRAYLLIEPDEPFCILPFCIELPFWPIDPSF